MFKKMNRLLDLVKWLVWTKHRPLWLSHMDTIFFYKLLLGPETCHGLQTEVPLSTLTRPHEASKSRKDQIIHSVALHVDGCSAHCPTQRPTCTGATRALSVAV